MPSSSDNDELTIRRQHVAQMLMQASERFLIAYRKLGLTPQEEALFIACLNQPLGFVTSARHLRDLIVRLNNTDLSGPIWMLIDAIGFWEDAHPGRWPYTSENDFHRLLNWSEELAGHLTANSQ